MATRLDPVHPGVAALERLRRIAEAVRDTDDGRWLATVLGAYEACAPDGARLDETCRLVPGPGQQPWWSARRRAERDSAIRELAATFTGSASARSLAAAEAIRRYEGAGWRHDRARGGPQTSDARRRLLFAIFSADEDPPKSMRRVYDIVCSG
jgi:hypothetical protein